MKVFFNILVVLLPWPIRRFILNHFYGYQIHKKARIGLSYIYPKRLVMEEGAKIGHLNVGIKLELISMEKKCNIGRLNWITGMPHSNTKWFQQYPDRKSELIMKEDSTILRKHHIDCTDRIMIGALSRIAGYHTQILTHSTSIEFNTQACAPVTIGHHCFVGTRSVILPGAVLPDQSVLGAGAVLQKSFTESFALYGGVPAKFVKKMNEDFLFFHCTARPK